MKKDTSWEKVSSWYKGVVGENGHYYHREIIIPKLLRIMALDGDHLDLACGSGVLARYLPSKISYTGIDASHSLIGKQKNRKHQFYVGDIRKPLPVKKKDFSQASIILALQNIDEPEKVLKNAAAHLRKGAKFFLVLNHPCYRIPRQSHWGVDASTQVQYRRLDRYMTSLEIPIQTKPSLGKKSPKVFSYHHSISSITEMLCDAGFLIAGMHEWCSNKKSTGKYARREDRARNEFPLFLTIVAQKA